MTVRINQKVKKVKRAMNLEEEGVVGFVEQSKLLKKMEEVLMKKVN